MEKHQNIILTATNKICDTVKSTLGTKGRTVLYNTWMEDQNKPYITKDGATVAKSVRSENDFENMVISILREASLKTMLSAGDGTTTTCVIAQSIINSGINLLNTGVSYYEIAKGIDEAVNDVKKYLIKNSIPAESNLKTIQEVASISANDEQIGKLIYDIISDIGVYGNIEVKRSMLYETQVEKTKGLKTHKGWMDTFMINNYSKELFEAKQCAVLVIKGELRNWDSWYAYYEVLEEGTPLLVFCDDMSEQVHVRLKTFIETQKAPVCFVENDGYKERKEMLCDDIAIITGGRVVLPTSRFDVANLGYAEEVVVSQTSTSIVGGNTNEEEASQVIQHIKNLLESDRLNANTEMSNIEKKFYQKRLANYTGGVAVINVGGRTQVETNELKDRFDDAVLAAEAAIREGVSCGGGYTFLNCKNFLESKIKDVRNNKNAYKLILNAIEEPFRQLLINSDQYSKYDDIKSKLLSGFGYDLRNNEFIKKNRYKVYDATAVLLDALVNAVSVAKSLLSVKELIYDGIRLV